MEQPDSEASNGIEPKVERLLATLSIGFMPGVSKLCPGTYFLALDPAAGDRLPLTANHAYMVPRDFPCVVLSVLESPREPLL